MSEWQDISTAPKDGTEILVTYGRQMFVMELVRYSTVHNVWMSKGLPRLGLEANATHWMPLPPPPKDSSGGQAMNEYDKLLKGSILPMPIKDGDIVAWRLLVADMFERGHYDERNAIADAAMIIERLLKEREAKP